MIVNLTRLDTIIIAERVGMIPCLAIQYAINPGITKPIVSILILNVFIATIGEILVM